MEKQWSIREPTQFLLEIIRKINPLSPYLIYSNIKYIWFILSKIVFFLADFFVFIENSSYF